MDAFKAFQVDDDQPAQLAITLDEYYGAIVQAAFPTYFEIGPAGIVPLQDAPGYGNIDLWSQNMRLIGYIPQDGYHARTVDTILSRIADEENKYYYKWMSDSGALAKDDSDNDALVALRRVNALVYYNIITDPIQTERLTSSWAISGLDKSAFLPFAISLDAYFLENGKYFFGVYTNANAVPLFLDTDDENKNYMYKKEGSVYKRQPTAQPASDPKRLSNIIEGFDSKTFDALQVPDEREKYWLIMQIKKTNNSVRLKNKLPASLRPTSRYKTFWSKQTSTLLDCFLDTYRKEMSDGAADAAAQLPIGYKCFYYSKANELAGVLSNVNVGEGRRGSGGYAMRADRAEEVEYQWQIAASPDVGELAFVMSCMIGLDGQYQVPGSQAVDGSYFPTNWLVGRGPAGASWNHYYKRFRDGAARRNAPSEPIQPRVITAADQDSKKYFKLDNRSYRVWKKGSDFAGEVLKDGTAALRQPAGSVMAAALLDFDIYASMINANPKITRSSLPATQFVQYALSNNGDEKVKTQWSNDNDTMDVDGPQVLRTDQEWCHLFGHGDGGSEELGNFVAGSKHCNTEQLAIETGLRRVTQNKDTEEIVKNRLKARITAYLFPNEGAWVERTYTFDQLEKGFPLSAQSTNEIKQAYLSWMLRFFADDPSNSLQSSLREALGLGDDNSQQPMDVSEDDLLKYGLKEPSECQIAYQDLSAAITKKIDTDMRRMLFQFRGNIERNIFQMLPIARWMRYKIYLDDDKIFDHVYDAQSQSFDYNEARILDYTVERIIYQAMGRKNIQVTRVEKDAPIVMNAWDYYKSKIADRLGDSIPNPEQISDIDNALVVYGELKWISVLDIGGDDVDQEIIDIYDIHLSSLKALLPSGSKRPKTDNTDSVTTLVTRFFEDINVDEIKAAIETYIDTRSKDAADGLKTAVLHAIDRAKQTEIRLTELRQVYNFSTSLRTAN